MANLNVQALCIICRTPLQVKVGESGDKNITDVFCQKKMFGQIILFAKPFTFSMTTNVNTTRTLEFLAEQAFNTKCKVRVVIIMIVTKVIIPLRV